MGFFSFMTQDTDRSIANRHSSEPTFPVIMKDDKGNKWVENNYDGYGIFGGKDFYELLAEMNGLKTRMQGITLYFEPKKNTLYPSLNEYDKTWVNERVEDCENQGFFYPGEEEEEEDFFEDDENEDYEDYID